MFLTSCSTGLSPEKPRFAIGATRWAASERNDSVSSAPSSYGPDLPSESRSLSRRSGSNHRNRVLHVHGATRVALDTHNGVHPLAEGFGSADRIVLAGWSSESCAFECIRAAHVTDPARPDKILGRVVFFVPVHVSDFDVALPSTQGANALARRWATIGTISQGTVSYINRVFSPILPAPPGGGQSSSSSSSSSDSSSSSPLRMSRAFPTA
jgi:hypothetical protein